MTVRIRVSGNGISNLKKRLQAAHKVAVVGVMQSPERGNSPSYSQIAQWLEYGWVQQITSKQSHYFGKNHGIHLKVGNTLVLPPRPFFRGTIQENRDKWMQTAKALLAKDFDPDKVLNLIARDIQAAIQASIARGGTETQQFERLSPMTMELKAQKAAADTTRTGRQKRRDGTGSSTSDRPFASDGAREIMNLISYEIRDK
jgi:hypothetical protein